MGLSADVYITGSCGSESVITLSFLANYPAPPTMATPTTFLRQLQSTLRHSHFSFSNSHLVFSCSLPLRSWEDIMESVRKSFALKFSRSSEKWIFVGGLGEEILSGKQNLRKFTSCVFSWSESECVLRAYIIYTQRPASRNRELIIDHASLIFGDDDAKKLHWNLACCWELKGSEEKGPVKISFGCGCCCCAKIEGE